MPLDHDCELELDTDEVDMVLEGEYHKDLETCLETMIKIANKAGMARCIFTVYKSESKDDKDNE